MRIPPLLLFACLALPATAYAQHGRQSVIGALDATAVPVTEGGFRSDLSVFQRDELMGMLAEGATSMVEIWLDEGVEYFIAAACADTCGDLDLRLLGVQSPTPLAQDVGGDTYPMITISAPAGGPFLLAIDMVSCREDQCYYGVRTFRR